MLDLKFIRSNPDVVRAAIRHKNEKADLDNLLRLDSEKRRLQYDFDNLRAEQNEFSQQVPLLKKEGKDISSLLKSMGDLAARIKEISTELNDVAAQLDTVLLTIPNLPHDSVPVGNNETCNQVIRSWGEKKDFSFPAQDYLQLSENAGYLDFMRAAKLSGSGFIVYLDKGAQLERALINFMLDYHITKHDYKEISLPVLVNRTAMTGTGQLPKLEEDMYHIEQDDLFLIPTAEVSITNYYAGEIVSYLDLPQKFVSYSPCFRREAGSYGKDTKGLQRVHQFNKVEMVRLVHPEQSYQALEEMLQDAEDILQALGLHYRIVSLCTGDLSFASAKTYDLEVWAPGSQKYYEVSSVSNFEDFQARRASIRFRDQDDKVKFVHTLNGSGLATPRTFIALLETWQHADGSIRIPDCLGPYLKGLSNILD